MGLTETCAPILSNPINPKKENRSPANRMKLRKNFDVNYKELKPNIIGQPALRGQTL